MTKRRAKEKPRPLFGTIPTQIEAEWSQEYAHLAGFPLNLVYTGLRDSDGQDPPRPVGACYIFAADTYREDEQRREMLYVSLDGSPYHVRIAVRKDTGAWEIDKYRGPELVCAASGPNFKIAMFHATLAGLEPDEPESHFVKLSPDRGPTKAHRSKEQRRPKSSTPR